MSEGGDLTLLPSRSLFFSRYSSLVTRGFLQDVGRREPLQLLDILRDCVSKFPNAGGGCGGVVSLACGHPHSTPLPNSNDPQPLKTPATFDVSPSEETHPHPPFSDIKQNVSLTIFIKNTFT